MSRRFWLLSALALFCFSSGLALLVSYRHDYLRLQQQNEAEYLAKVAIEEFANSLKQAKTVEDFELLEIELSKLPEEKVKEYQPAVTLGLIQRYYDLAEEKIELTQSLLSAVPANAISEKYFQEALGYYSKAKEKVDSMAEVESSNNFNFHLYYSMGNIYFRVLLFLADSNEAPELFDQMLASWQHALHFKEKDIDTEINIEYVLKNQNKLLSGARAPGNRPDTGRLRMLPGGGIGQGRRPGVH